MKAQWGHAAEFIETNARVESDVAVFSAPQVSASYIQDPFDYYYTGELQKFVITAGTGDTQELTAFTDKAVRGRDRLWLIMSHGGTKVPIRSYLESRYGSEAILSENQFKGVLIILFDVSSGK